MNILFTICARAGSKGLKNKNIATFLDYPISYYTLSAYELFRKKNTQYKTVLAVNTDSSELIKQIENTSIPFTYIERIPELAGDVVGKIDVIRDTHKKIHKNFDFIIDLDITSPLRTVENIEGVLNAAICTPLADGAFSMTHARRSPYFNQVKKNDNGFYSSVIKTEATARQQVPQTFDMNASIYVFRPQFLENTNYKKLFDGHFCAYAMIDTAVLDIDEQEDKELMEVIAEHLFTKKNNFAEIKEYCSKIARRKK